ncbi:cryptochrome/photolyase family protein [Psychroflexus aestuariivivens]|uniref:cryptochrome/photolyase family protein n=1 Tax=Psychroflexus aestuariivivens TaxID=1795040 RepID=UPI000FD9023B|nr:cryptochrome/photolyase family protein [Psychroflexus aestuariivivens]
MKKTLRLILGDQLNYNHSWLDDKNENLIYFMAETKEETTYVKHHIQKVVGFFISMRQFAEHLKSEGHRIVYYEIDSEDNQQDLIENLNHLIEKYGIEKFEYQMPDEFRLDQKLKAYCNKLEIDYEVCDSEHFYTKRSDVADFYEGKKGMTMEYFYRDMRKKHDILINAGQKPEGGQWNFDKSNRKKWSGNPSIPKFKSFDKNVESVVNQIQSQNIKTMGRIDEKNFVWPCSRAEALEVLDYFCETLLVHFGDYEDAMHTDEKFLFHSRLSFVLNTKMLSPKEVIDAAVETYYSNKKEIDISQIEGFVRQILGWREYMRGLYWHQMPGYKSKNKLENHNKLPDFYWTGKTDMNCLKHSVNQSLDEAYAHHIQRLMVLGNFALLNMTDPDEVDNWYLGVYIDAIEWVEITNTRGMSQFADGGIIATKPYVSSGSYINKMSNYCKSCKYAVNKKEGDDACPFNNLYWNFLYEKQEHFENNQRMNMMMSMLKKMKKATLNNHLERAKEIIKNPDKF